MGVLGMGPHNSYVEVGDDELRVRMGWSFQATVPRSSIIKVGRRGYVWWAYGVHGGVGRWIVNGSGHNMVTVRIDPPAKARVLGVRVKLKELWLSLEDPDGFLAATGR
jgi:hypothetical protein